MSGPSRTSVIRRLFGRYTVEFIGRIPTPSKNHLVVSTRAELIVGR